METNGITLKSHWVKASFFNARKKYPYRSYEL